MRVVEGYRSYPESRPGYQADGSAEPGYAENPGWYERGQPDPDQRGWAEPEPYEERLDLPRSEPPRQPADPARAAVGIRPGLPSGERPGAPRRPPVAAGSPGSLGESLYRSKRPGAAVLVWLPAAILELPALLLLVDAASGGEAAGVVAGASLVIALPMLALGLYSVATGAVRAAGPNSGQAWLRPPVAYLTVALVLFLAAGLAA